MTRYRNVLLCLVAMAAITGVAYAQSLGDVARKERSKPKPQAARVYTNDDIPSVDVSKEDSSALTAASISADKRDKKEKSSVEEQNALNAEWKARVAKQKADIADLEHELDLMQREEKLRVAVYYSDAGNRLRNSKDWDDQEKKYQADLTDKQKKLADAKAKLDSTLESARRAGATGYE